MNVFMEGNKHMSEAEETHKQHEVIRAKQRQSSEPFTDSNPSEVHEVFWIIAKRKLGEYPLTSPQSGKWLIFVPNSQIDEIWKLIKQATEEGNLGGSAKVSTMRPNANSNDESKKVICVYTYDWTDEEDVMRVRGALRALGHTQKLAYKSDQATMEGKYQVSGHSRISKYWL